MNRVLDAGPMIAYLRNEVGGPAVAVLLNDPNEHCVAHAVNVCEVYYDFIRVENERVAEDAIETLINAGLEIREDLDADFWRLVGRLKAAPPRKAIADCFGLALASRLDGEFITTDHGEMDALAPLGICSIRFIR